MATAKIRHLLSWHRRTFTMAPVPDNSYYYTILRLLGTWRALWPISLAISSPSKLSP